MAPDCDVDLLKRVDQALSAKHLVPIPACLRADYHRQRQLGRCPKNRAVVIGLMVIFDLFWFSQAKSAPELVTLSGLLRLLVMTPACVVFICLDRAGRLGRFYDTMLVTLSAIAAFITALLCLRTTSLTTLSDIRSTPLILLTTGLVMRLSPGAAMINALICASAFIGSILASPVVPRFELGSLILSELALAVITCSFTVMLEDRDRRVFLLRTIDHFHRAELAAQNRGLREETHTDALTGVANRRGFDETLATRWRQALEAGKSIGLLMMDIDHFKAFNDHYGHQSGDECLRLVAAQASAQVRAGDLLARYGGEEFAVVLPEAGIECAVAIAERIRTAIEALALRHCGLGDQAIVTVSLGVASVVPADARGFRRLIERADQDLYEAKRDGRNRVGGRSKQAVPS